MAQKYGLISYSSHPTINAYGINIGDYIQSIAAKQFLPHVDLLIDRERLSDYGGEKVKVIMNGWYMHFPENWPPSSKIIPLFVAFHINSSAADILLTEQNIAYLKKYEPIGCRDYHTFQLLTEKGVNAYFSACLTLTLGETYKINHRQRSDKIFFVDPFLLPCHDIKDIVLSFWQSLKRIKIIPEIMKMTKGNRFRAFVRAGFFYKTYKQLFTEDILNNAIYLSHIHKLDSDSFSYAEKLVKQYASAGLVITSRIHCALPCLGLETPVIYIHNDAGDIISDCRLDRLLDLLNVVTLSSSKTFSCPNFLNTDINGKITRFTKIKNKTTYISYKENLISICKKFIHESIHNHTCI